MHTVTEDSAGLPKEPVVVSALCLFVCGGGVIAAHAVLCFKAAPLSGESVVLPITVTPKDAQLREGERDVYWKVVSCW